MLALANELTLEGHIVLMPFVLKVDDAGLDESLQKLHRAKIDMSTDVYFLLGLKDGQSTVEEMDYARSMNKAIYSLRGFPSIGKQDDWEIWPT